MPKIISCEFDYKQFLNSNIKKSPIKIGNTDEFKKEKEEEFKDIQTYFTDDFVNGFIDWVREGYSNVVIDDLKPRCFEIEGVGPFLIGQRFKNGDINMPFILLILGFEEERLLDVIEDIKKIAKECFSKISPLGVTVNLRFLNALPQNSIVWNQLVYGKFDGEIENKNVRLEAVSEAMPYDVYCKVYDDWSKQNSELSRFINKEPELALTESAKAGLYFKFYVDDEFAGIICARKDNLYGHEAIYIMEELLIEKFRGKGFAKIMQRLFHKKFPDVEYIWGHILDDNKPSLRTAFSCGRKILERECFFPFS